MTRHAPTARAFTLIELLVVIAIIASLLAILMPSLNKATYEAISTVCASNKRQVGTATLTYAADFKRYYPARHPDATTHNLPFWFGWTNSYSKFHEVIERYYGGEPGGEAPDILLCAVSPDGVLGSGVGWPNGTIYRTNVNLFAGFHWASASASACQPQLPLNQMPQKVGDVPGRPLAGDLIEYLSADSVGGHSGWTTPHSIDPAYHYRATGNPEESPTSPQPFVLGDGSVQMVRELEAVFRDDGYGTKYWAAP